MIPQEVKTNIDIYEEILSNLCQLFIELGISDNPLKIYETFRYMYHNGYLSIGEYSDQIPPFYIKLELNGYIPMDITGSLLFTSYGVCRHTSDFLSHIYSGLEYDNSQLFTYHPDLKIHVVNSGINFLTNKEAQEYIDETLIGFNFFDKKENHLTRHLEDISITIDYYPPDLISNHTMNIVKSKTQDKVHIVDTRYHCVGERISKKRVRFHDCGLTHVDFIQTKVDFHTYYRTNYYHGLELLEKKTDIDKDVLSSILYQDFCQRVIEKCEEFRRKNLRNYMHVTNNYQKLIKKIN